MNLFNFIKSNIAILDVVKEYTTLKPAGRYWKGHCPVHSEKTASFTVSPDKEIFYCFGCHTGGDVITFIAKVENCSPIEAAHQLVDRYQLNVPETINTKTTKQNTEQKIQYYKLCEAVAQWCHDNALKNASVCAYFKKRGIGTKQQKRFCLGYFPAGLQSIKLFMTTMKKQDFLPQDLVEAGLLFEGKTVLYSPFEDRIIFPIKDHLGRFLGFGGRVYKQQDERVKYYNTSENNFFTKGNLLFGIDVAKKSIQKTEQAFVVEGYTDCIAMAQHGYPNTVATLGTACTIAHLTMLSRYAKQLYVLYDRDKAGYNAIIRLTNLCWKVDLELKVITLPQGADPASYLKIHETINPLLESSHDIFSFFIDGQTTEYATQPLAKKISIARTVTDMIRQIQDPLKRDILLAQAADKFGIPFAALDRHTQPDSKSIPPSETIEQEEKDRPGLEKTVFFAIMNNIGLINSQQIEAITGTFTKASTESMGRIITQLATAKTKNKSLDFPTFFSQLSDIDQQYVSKVVMHTTQPLEQQEFDQLLLQIQKRQWKKRINEIKALLANEQTVNNHETIANICTEFLELKNKLLKKDII